jgi:hypothetical protein
MKIQWSDERHELAAALALAQGQIRTANKDSVAKVQMKSGGQFTYKYSTLDDNWAVARKPLSDNGLAVVQIPTNDESGFYLETTVLHSSGQWVSGVMVLPILTDRMSALQAMGSAITYARRYMLGAMVGVTTGDDDDGHQASTGDATRQAARSGDNGNGKFKKDVAEAWETFLGRARIELGLSEEDTKSMLKDLDFDGFKPEKAQEMFEILDDQMNEGVTTETGLLVLVNRETDNYYKHRRHLQNAVKKIDPGFDYPPGPGQAVQWQTILAMLVDHASASSSS